MSYIKIINALKDTLTATDQLPLCRTVTEGDLYEIDLKKQTIFPLTHIVVNSATFENQIVRFNISLISMDIVDISKLEATDQFTGNDNEQYVLNNMLALQSRIHQLLLHGSLSNEGYEVDGFPSSEPFRERHENNLAGWTLTFDVIMDANMSIC